MTTIEQQLKECLQKPYENAKRFLADVIFPVFGEDNFEDAGNANVLRMLPELQPKADATGIKDIRKVGDLLIEGSELGIFDITLVDYKKQLQRNRVEVQQIVRSIIATHSGAFIIFHYESGARWEWRFTFCHKGASASESSDAKRYTFLLGPGQSCRTAAENFTKIHEKIEREGEFEMQDIISAFDVEALSKEFFAKYKNHYERFCQFVYENKNDRQFFGEQFSQWEDKVIRDYVKKLLGRIVFLHFIQKKGWLGVPADKTWNEGDRQFMKNLYDRASQEQKDNYLDIVLEPLFQKGLDRNRSAEGDIFDTGVEGFRNVKIPYLNGGLFERDVMDEPDSRFPSEYFGDLLEFLYEYNFTIDENDPNDAEVGVDPEMLGRIFENLLEDNKDKGAFYTPKEIVQYMCRESLIAYLTTNSIENGNTNPRETVEKSIRNLVLNPEEIVPKMNDKQKEGFGDALRKVKICDPAIGSGAFPMGLLNELVRCRVAISAWAKDNDGNVLVDDYAALKREIVCNNIYGVDIERGAIDIARLRFWLSIVVDEKEPHALPNLDYKFMEGNSLIPTFDGQYINLDTEGQKHVNVIDMKKEKRQLYNLKQEHYNATGLRKHQLAVGIKDCILRLISLQLGYELRQWYEQNVVQTSLFPDDKLKQFTFADIKQTLPPEKQHICDLGAELRAKLKNTTIPIEERAQLDIRFFDWRMMFTEVFEGDHPGFDIVIGNPPYLRIQGIKDVNPILADLYAKTFISASGSFDLYVCFTEQGLNLIKANGIVNFIMPIKWSNSSFGKGLRTVVSSKKAANKIINFGAFQVFNASTYTALQWFVPNTNHLKYKELDKDLTTNSELGIYLDSNSESSFSLIDNSKLSKDTWKLSSGEINKLLCSLEKQPCTVNDYFDKVFQGLATGKDDVFFLNDCEVFEGYITGYSKFLGSVVSIESELAHPLLKGEDVHRYSQLVTNRYVVLPYKTNEIEVSLLTENDLSESFPSAYEYFKKCENILRSREKGRFDIDGAWFQLSRKQGLASVQNEKIVAPDICMGGNFTIDMDGKYYQTATIYGYIKKDSINLSYKSLLAILNSNLCWWYIKSTGAVMSGGYYRYKPAYIKPFPMPSEHQIALIQDELEVLVNEIMSKKLTDQECNVIEEENKIDDLVYKLYELSDTDISLIKKSINSNE